MATPTKHAATVFGMLAGVSDVTVPVTVLSGASMLTVRISVHQAMGTVTYGGVPLALIADVQATGGIAAAHAQLWALASPTAGLADVVITPTVSTFIAWTIDQWAGVDPSVPFGTPATFTTASVLTAQSYAASSVIDDLVLDVMGFFRSGGGYTVTVGANQIEDSGQVFGTGQTQVYASREVATGPTTTTDYTTTLGAFSWGVAVALKGVSTAPIAVVMHHLKMQGIA